MAMKKGIFFTIDSLLASGILIIALILISNFYSSEHQMTNVNYAAQDIVRVFSSMTLAESDNDYVKSLIASGYINNSNLTIIEQIGEFWINGRNDLASNLTKNLTGDIIPSAYGLSILVDDEEIYSRNIPVRKTLVSSRKMISGIAKAKPTEGFTARVLLTGIKSKKTNAYAYFGGYEGDGNLSKKLMLPVDVISFNSSYLEVDAGGNFNLYINDVFSGAYIKGSTGGGNMHADKWNLSDAYLANFRPGENAIKVNFTSGNSYIAGGFLRVTYTTSSYNDTLTSGYEKYWFPGINGIINLYSSIYAGGSLNSMKIFLNYSSNYTLFLKLGNATIYEGKSNSTATDVTISNSTLGAILDYSSLSQKAIPLRLGLKDLRSLTGGNADIVLITDVSGSMNWRLDNGNTGTTRNCDDPLLYDPSTKRISVAKCLDKQFVDIILNSSLGNTTNKIGLVAYSGIPNFIPTASSTIIVINHSLSSNNVSLKAQIDAYNPSGATGICGSIRNARTILEQQSNSTRKKFIIVMTDGLA
ncbi:VWA domain-containing protein, partial [Candidatus Woesearchaeota archaeon]|nr:VWA domain-containing protein [Candidatus Woesearchaeota archaeon]